MVQIHYQLLNTLQMSQDEVDLLVKPSLDYLDMIQTDPAVLRYHIRYSGENEKVKGRLQSYSMEMELMTEKTVETPVQEEGLDPW